MVAWVVLVASAVPAIAQAQKRDACKEGYERGSVSRDSGRFVEARGLLQQCGSASCAPAAQKKCAAVLADVEAHLASVILSAGEARSGIDLTDVAVSIDGREGPRKLDGRAQDVDPGEHTFVFQLADGRKAEKRVTLRAGERNASVSVTIGAAAPVAGTAVWGAAMPAAPAWSANDVALAEEAKRMRYPTSPLKIAGFAFAGVGVAGLAVGSTFGLMASNKKSSPQCDAVAKVCDPGVLDEARRDATISTVGFVAGAALLVGGLTLVVVAPKNPMSARVQTAPAIGANGGGLSLQGAW